MGDYPSRSPPPSHPTQPKSNLAMLYYCLVVVGTAAVVLVAYNLIIMRFCTDHHRRQGRGIFRWWSRSFDTTPSAAISLVSSFKYKKEGSAADVAAENRWCGGDQECAVCLSEFEEGEEVRRLPPCNHCFHVGCIDMWLYSHHDCPLCRAPVASTAVHRQAVSADGSAERSREVLLYSGISF